MTAPSPTSAFVLVTGLGKTGTSGLYTSVKAGLANAGIEARTFFEPHRPTVLYDHFRLAPSTPVLTKIILQQLRKMDLPPQAFDRRIMTVRDPRDTAVSGLLFRPLITAVLKRVDDAAVATFVDALRQKERDPSSISVVELYRLSSTLKLGGPPKRLLVDVLDLQRKLVDEGAFHVVRYEDFVAGRLSDLSDYLGYPVENVSAHRSGIYGHVSRSEGAGSFRDWFTPEDVEFFHRIWGPFLERFGYPLDVELTAAPVIDPATSSEYVASRVRKRRDMLANSARHTNPERTVATADWPAVWAELTERGGDGDQVACVRAARLALSGRLGAVRKADALHWARVAAEMGSIPGMQLTVQLLESACAPAEIRERLGWRRELEARESEVDARLAAELDATRKSASFRLGNALVRAARAPRADGMDAVREVRHLWRERRQER